MSDKDAIDLLIERTVGHDRPAPPATPKPKRRAKPKPKPKPKDTMPSDAELEKAAEAIQKAVTTHTGRRRKVDAWKPVAAKVLKRSRVYNGVWDAVLAKGVELGLFRVDDKTLSFPILEPLDPEPKFVDEQPEPEPGPPPKKPWKLKPLPPRKPPEERRYVYHLACGHSSSWLRKDKDGEPYCHACKLRTPADHVWMSVNRGVPIPPRRRRSEAHPQGHCCDADGQYIGGLEGDCRYSAMKHGTPVCDYHKDRPLWGRKGQ